MMLPGILLPGLLGFGAARVWMAGNQTPVSRAAVATTGQISPPAPRANGSTVPSPEERLLAKARAGSDAAVALLTESAGSHPDRFARLLFEHDPAGTLAFIDGLSDRRLAATMARHIFEWFPASEFPRLQAWVKRQPPGEFRSQITAHLLPFWIRGDRAGAVAAAVALGESPGAAETRRSLLQHLMVKDRLAALGKIPVAERLSYLKEQAGPVFSSTLPEETAAVIASLPASGDRQAAMASLCTEWARKDPAGAVRAVSSLADAALRASALQTTAAAWCGVDAVQAGNWARTLPPGPERDAAAAGIAGELSRDRIDASTAWAESIGDPALRAETMENAMKRWREKNPESTGLPAEEKQIPATKPAQKP